ncbi:30S ribosomal protein S18 [Candidatus Aerophobetes bacterium]|uniref:Small ribosomal subunit protein bS18 n=1 Tax=Aerophobetes bacterium TaxID=2030807 RepID=A0A662D527_UNCAE|nr:MAG: 30S ribosomal protein S18 [Candidatus Aerophobetes bacterium]
MLPKPKFRGRKVCKFCSSRKDSIDYRDVRILSHYIDSRARIKNRRRTGVCAKHQRTLAKAIKRAREMALLPYK